jgi:hypothetical protein
MLRAINMARVATLVAVFERRVPVDESALLVLAWGLFLAGLK